MEVEQKLQPDSYLTELRQVFNSVDTDGSGHISSSELHRVIEKATGQAPSERDLNLLMRKMDANNDGTISWEEFHTAIAEWLAEDEKVSQSAGDDLFGKRKSPTGGGRADIHRRIHGFFRQFQRHKDFDQMRQTLVNEVMNTSRDDAYDSEAILNAQERLERLDRSHAIIAQLSDVTQGIQSNDVEIAVACTQALADLLAVTEIYSTATERYEAGEFLMSVYNLVAETGIIGRVVNFMGVDESPQLQYEAARALTYYCPGPRVPHTPPESIFYPEKMHQKQTLFANSIHIFIAQMLGSSNLSCREQACDLIAALASYDAAARDFLYECGIFNLLCDQIDPQDLPPTSYLVKIARALSIFCGVTHSELLTADQLEAALPRLAVLFLQDDQTILKHVTAALSFIFPGIEIDAATHERLMSLLAVPIDEVLHSTLKLLSAIATVDREAVEIWINMGLLDRLSEMLHKISSTAIRAEICNLLGSITIRHGLASYLIDQNIFPALFQVLLTDDSLRGRIIRIIRAIVTTPAPKDVRPLVERFNIVKALSLSMALFKTWDDALMDLYSSTTPAYNFSFVSDVFATLNELIDIGERLVLLQTNGGENEGQITNPFTRHFGMQLLDSVFYVMRIFSTECASDPFLWTTSTTASAGSNLTSSTNSMVAFDSKATTMLDAALVSSLEDQMKRLLTRIRDMHVLAHSAFAQAISTRIAAEEKQYTEQMQKSRSIVEAERSKRSRQRPLLGSPTRGAVVTGSDDDVIAVKFILRLSNKDDDFGDNRVASVHRGILLHEFMRVIQQKYGRRYVPQIEDAEGDLITIDTQDALSDIMARASSSDRIKFHLLNPALATGGVTVVPNGGSGKTSSALENINSQDLSKQRSQIVNELYQATEFTKEQLHRLFTVFQHAAKDGYVDRASFNQCLDELKLPGFDNEEAVDILFKGFDKGNQGIIDVRNFIGGLAAINGGSYDTRIEFLFRAYDLDGSGSLSRDEIASCAQTLLESRGSSMDGKLIEAFIESAFKHDTNGDGELDFQEFKRAMMNEKTLMTLLWSQIKPEDSVVKNLRVDSSSNGNHGGNGHHNNNGNNNNRNNNNNNNNNKNNHQNNNNNNRGGNNQKNNNNNNHNHNHNNRGGNRN